MTTPGRSQASDPGRRYVGESLKDYADRIYGMYRALQVDMQNLQVTLAEAARVDPCDPCRHARSSHADGVGQCSECDCDEWWKVK